MADMQWNGDRAVNQLDDAIERGLQAGAELWLDESNRKAPIETGALIRSGVAISRGKEAAVGYNTPYAARQHEELGYRHDDGREAKFLENAGTNNADRIIQAVAGEVRRALS